MLLKESIKIFNSTDPDLFHFAALRINQVLIKLSFNFSMGEHMKVDDGLYFKSQNFDEGDLMTVIEKNFDAEKAGYQKDQSLITYVLIAAANMAIEKFPAFKQDMEGIFLDK